MIPCTVACQTPLSMVFLRQEYWSGLPFPSPDLPDPGIEPKSPALADRIVTTEPLGKPYMCVCVCICTGFYFLHIPANTCYFVSFIFIIAILTVVQCYLAVLICISLITGYVEHLFMCSCVYLLAICMSSLE